MRYLLTIHRRKCIELHICSVCNTKNRNVFKSRHVESWWKGTCEDSVSLLVLRPIHWPAVKLCICVASAPLSLSFSHPLCLPLLLALGLHESVSVYLCAYVRPWPLSLPFTERDACHSNQPATHLFHHQLAESTRERASVWVDWAAKEHMPQ